MTCNCFLDIAAGSHEKARFVVVGKLDHSTSYFIIKIWTLLTLSDCCSEYFQAYNKYTFIFKDVYQWHVLLA